MPLALDPEARAEFWLASDADKPADTRPTFICRFMTRRQFSKFILVMNDAITIEGGDEKVAKIKEALGIALIGWRNIDVPFSIDAIEDVLTPEEVWELPGLMVNAVITRESDLKKSASQSASPGAESARTADRASAGNGSIDSNAPDAAASDVTPAEVEVISS